MSAIYEVPDGDKDEHVYMTVQTETITVCADEKRDNSIATKKKSFKHLIGCLVIFIALLILAGLGVLVYMLHIQNTDVKVECQTPNVTVSIPNELVKQSYLPREEISGLTCAKGEQLFGDSSIICQEDGTWLLTASCANKANGCKVPVDVLNGVATMAHDARLKVKCTEGFENIDDESSRDITCRLGDWVGEFTSVCTTRKCLVSYDLGNLDTMKVVGVVGNEISKNELIDSGAIVLPECKTGFEPQAEQSLQILCDRGNWTDIFICVEQKCTLSTGLGQLDVMTVKNVDGKELLHNELVDSGTIVVPECKKGFDPQVGQTMQISCDRGNWTGTFICVKRPCPKDWILENNGSCYMFVKYPRKSWEAAGEHCGNSGGHLVEVNSRGENAWLQQKLQKMSYDGDLQYFTAGNDIEEEDNWVWGQGGHQIQHTYWGPKEPSHKNLGDEEDCLAFAPKLDFAWNDLSCLLENYFICEYP